MDSEILFDAEGVEEEGGVENLDGGLFSVDSDEVGHEEKSMNGETYEGGEQIGKAAKALLDGPGEEVEIEETLVENEEVSGGGPLGTYGRITDESVIASEVRYLESREIPPVEFRYVTMKLPSVITVDLTGHAERSDKQRNAEDGLEIRFFQNPDSTERTTNQSIDNHSNPTDSNARLVEWEDGTFTLFVDNQPYLCELHDDSAYLFEASQDDVYILHAAVDGRLQVRVPAQQQIDMRRKRKPTIRQMKTKVATHHEAENMRVYTQKFMDNRRDAERMKRRQADSTFYNFGLSGSFLEAENSGSE